MNNGTYQLTGRLHERGYEVFISERFTKREFVVSYTGEAGDEYIKFQLVQDSTKMLDAFQVGQRVTVTYTLRGRGFNKNGQMLWFTSLEAIAIEEVAPTGLGHA